MFCLSVKKVCFNPACKLWAEYSLNIIKIVKLFD